MMHKSGDSPVFLLSMPRSGSTLLSLMLGSHPEVCCPPEPWIVLALAEYMELGNVRDTPYGREWCELAAFEFLLNPERKQRGVLGKALRGIGETSGLDDMTAARKLLHAAYQMHLDVSGKSVFIDKTPRYYTVLGLIDEIFPRAKKIVLLRNPLDIYSSYKSTWGTQRSIFTAEKVSVNARDFCEGLFTLADYIATGRDDVLVLRYEDVASDPERVLRTACEFSGLDFSPAMLTYYENTALSEEYRKSPVGDPIASGQPASANNRTVNSWDKRLEQDDIQTLMEVLGIRIFERLGYGDAIARLQGMSIRIPTEEQAFKRRNSLMQALVDNVREPPFSSWDNFISPLKESQARVARLGGDRAQQIEMAGLQEELKRLRSFSGFLGFKFGNLIRRMSGNADK